MANHKTGFSYYNVDTDRYQDIKIKRLKKDFGCAGIAVYDYILSEIYRVKGCFIEWDESRAFDVADYFGIKESLVNEIVNYCCSVGLFDKGLLSIGGVLSSIAIQKRYIEMCSRAKRINYVIPEKYNIIPEVSAKIHEVSPISSGSLPQSKVKESKVEEYTKVISPADAEAPPSGSSFSEKAKFFIEQFNTIKGGDGKPCQYQLTTTVKDKLRARIRDGYTSKQIFAALRKAMSEQHHKENGLKWITPEFILRSDKLEAYLHADDAIKTDVPLTKAQKRRLQA